ncbi:hypothetical protein [Terriglobus sp. RCC_193]|uniref:hypothetical protein n=1 Tax=Terriglobus sp. RCC_193 TaxID=3239218 RepID=UPI003525B31B
MAYAIVDDAMHIQFQNGDVYVYTPAATGRLHLKVMRQLARAGAGLSTYISRQIRDRYSLKYKREVLEESEDAAPAAAQAATVKRRKVAPSPSS